MIRCVTFMDDFSLGCRGLIKGQQRAVKALDKWFRKEQKIELKETSGIVKLLSIEEEKHRRNLPKKAQRGVPMLDMAGYRISRTHVTIRRRVFKRARRQLLRGYKELKRDGTLRRERAQKIISYNSYITQSDSFRLVEKYHVAELMEMAHRVNSFYGWLENQKRKVELNVLRERRRESEAAESNDQSLPGGERAVRLTDNVQEYRQEEAKDWKYYRFDEVEFILPASETATLEEIEAEFETWWEYGKKVERNQRTGSPGAGTSCNDTRRTVRSSQDAAKRQCSTEKAERHAGRMSDGNVRGCLCLGR